jgi:hypothetical protein
MNYLNNHGPLHHPRTITPFPGNSAHHFHSMQIASHQSPTNNCPPHPKQIVWKYHRVWLPKPEPSQLGPYIFTPRQLDIAAIVCARRSPEDTSVTHVLEAAEAYQPRLTLTAMREYREVVRAIKRVLNAAPASAASQH